MTSAGRGVEAAAGFSEAVPSEFEFTDIPRGLREEIDLIWDYLNEQGGFILDDQRRVRLNHGSKIVKQICRELVDNLQKRLAVMPDPDFDVVQRYVLSKHQRGSEDTQVH